MFTTALNFIIEYRFIILLVVFVITFFIMIGKQKTKDILNSLIIQAKRLAKDTILKSGKEQEDWVVLMSLKYLPSYITIFLGEAKIRKIIQLLYQKAKDYCDDGVFNGSK